MLGAIVCYDRGATAPRKPMARTQRATAPSSVRPARARDQSKRADEPAARTSALASHPPTPAWATPDAISLVSPPSRRHSGQSAGFGAFEHVHYPRTYAHANMHAIRSHQMRSEAIRGRQRPSEVVRGHQRPSEAITGHQRPSEAIRGHQRPSEAIRGHMTPSSEAT
jgi:hypothetical protein